VAPHRGPPCAAHRASHFRVRLTSYRQYLVLVLAGTCEGRTSNAGNDKKERRWSGSGTEIRPTRQANASARARGPRKRSYAPYGDTVASKQPAAMDRAGPSSRTSPARWRSLFPRTKGVRRTDAFKSPPKGVKIRSGQVTFEPSVQAGLDPGNDARCGPVSPGMCRFLAWRATSNSWLRFLGTTGEGYHPRVVAEQGR
jgi:hypothetical protein